MNGFERSSLAAPRGVKKRTPYDHYPRNEADKACDNFLEDYFQHDPKAIIYSTIPKFSKSFIPASAVLPLPKSFSTLYQKDWTSLPYEDLIEKCKIIYEGLKITQEESDAVEKATASQHLSSTWFEQRIGRITASVAKSVISTPISTPAKTTVLKICEPNAAFYSKPTE